MVSLAKAVYNHVVTSMINTGTYDLNLLHHYKQTVMAFNDCYIVVSSLIRSDTKLTTVPESYPEDFDPEIITSKHMRTEVTREGAASIASRPHAGWPAHATPAPNHRPVTCTTHAPHQPD